MINKIIITTVIVLGTIQLQAQQSVHGSGGNATGVGGNSSYSVGQFVYKTETGSSSSVAQGVQQAFEVMLGIEHTEISLEMKVFPNPTASILNLSFGDYDISDIKYSIYDLTGKQIVLPTAVVSETTIDVSNLNTSMYLLTITKNNKPLKIYKIIKN